jgi:hypothetical protein
MQVVGGRGALIALPVERAQRGLCTGTLMPPSVDRMLGTWDKSVQGIEAQGFGFGAARLSSQDMRR